MLSKTRKALLKELRDIQNHPYFEHQDIMTITGFMKTDQEVREHIERNRETLRLRG